MKKLTGLMMLLCLITAVDRAAAVSVSVIPSDSVVDPADIFTVDLVADIPITEPVLGWGLDLSFDSSILSHNPLTDVVIGSSWNPGVALDGDGLVGVAFPHITGSSILLAMLTFEATAPGTSLLVAGADDDGLSEGFPLFPSGFAPITFSNSSVFVTPEPGTWMLMGTGLIGLAGYGWRRQKQAALAQ